MKQDLLKSIEENVNYIVTKSENSIDLSYNNHYSKTHESLKKEELSEIEKCDNVESLILSKILNTPNKINKLVKDRSEIPSDSHLKSAELNAKIDVANNLLNIYTDFSSKIAASKSK